MYKHVTWKPVLQFWNVIEEEDMCYTASAHVLPWVMKRGLNRGRLCSILETACTYDVCICVHYAYTLTAIHSECEGVML